jgi:hypothetical protein
MKISTILLVFLIVFGCFACEQDVVESYTAPDNIYFNFDDAETNDRDSITYTFAYTPEMVSDTVFLPLAVSGKRVNYDRRFKLEILTEGTSAQPQLHFEPLQDIYILQADSGKMQVPVILYNTDPALQHTTVTLNLVTVATEDFGVALPKLNKAKIVFSNRLEKPVWWNFWEDQLANYSRTKHEMYLVVVGNIDLITNASDPEQNLQIPRNLYLIDKLRKFLADPVSWVETNTRGYALTARADGNYDFYNTENPSKTYLLQKNIADGRYYFMDENGQQVIMY